MRKGVVPRTPRARFLASWPPMAIVARRAAGHPGVQTGRFSGEDE